MGNCPSKSTSCRPEDISRPSPLKPKHSTTTDAPPSYTEAVKSPDGFLAAPDDDSPRSKFNPFRRPRSSSPAPPSPSDSDHKLTHPTPKWTTTEDKLEYLRKPMRQESYEDALEILKQYNIVVIVDDSGSMTKDNRWQEAATALAALARTAAEYDTDGIDVFFLNSKKQGLNMKSAQQVTRLFESVSPGGSTPIGAKLDRLLRDYIDTLDAAKKAHGCEDSIKPVNYIVLTDGAATDEPSDVIVTASKRLDGGRYLGHQVGIQFVQIGNDKYATEFLKQLDDDLAEREGVRDIVDTTPYLGGPLDAEIMIKILLGGINRRVDRKGANGVMRG